MCEICRCNWSFYNDPRVVGLKKFGPNFLTMMLELASLGARVLHVRSVELAKLYNVPMCVRSKLCK